MGATRALAELGTVKPEIVPDAERGSCGIGASKIPEFEFGDFAFDFAVGF